MAPETASFDTLGDMSAPDAAANVVEVTDANFAETVIEESRRRPVVVDFWAEWCAPCRMIGPVLERLADEQAGAFLLGKLDVDANPEASGVFRIQGIPAVKAFRDGAIVDEFVGVIPEAAIREFLRGLVPSEADRIAAEGFEALNSGREDEAERLFRRALALDGRHRDAAIGLAQIAAGRGDVEEARDLLRPLRPDPEAERILAAIDVSGWASATNGQGPLAAAEHAAAEGRFVDALDGFLDEVRAGGEGRDAAREAMLKLFAVLGDDDPVTREYRTKLASALF
jgi:putative thioredoxin